MGFRSPVGISKKIQEVLAQGASSGVFPGAVAAWSCAKGPVETAWAGTTSLENGFSVDDGTLFDMASLTKPFVASVALRLVDRGELNLHATLAESCPHSFEAAPCGAATLEQVLSHEAGFAPWGPFFERVESAHMGSAAARGMVISSAVSRPLDHDPGTVAVYSDLGYMVLARLLEEVTGLSLGVLVRREVTGPLGLDSVAFGPFSGASTRTFAATESCQWRGKTMVGEVHDDNAWAMGGQSGHAGLFGLCEDVCEFGRAWLDAATRDGWLSASLARGAATRRSLGRGLGFDMVTQPGSSAGHRVGSRTFGHLGFTGCSLWIDPDAEVVAALLSNRVHPARENTAIRRFRPLFHDALYQLLFG